MAGADILVRVMDEAAHRVLSGTERAYLVALETAGELVYLDSDSESKSSWAAYVLWAEISDLLDAPGGPESEELCEDLAGDFARAWLALADRGEKVNQEAFMAEFQSAFDERVLHYLAKR